MRVPDPPTGDIFLWLPSCLHFVIITAGCACLIVYVFFHKHIYFAITGLALVGALWLFWIATYLYRCVAMHDVIPTSRVSGGRAGDGGSGSAENMLPRGGDAVRESSAETTTSTARRVRFGEAVVVEEHGPDQQEIMSQSSLSSSNIDDYHDISSPESRACERPFSELTP